MESVSLDLDTELKTECKASVIIEHSWKLPS